MGLGPATFKSHPTFDILSMYKLKSDLKETTFSPYKIPFNYEMLKQLKFSDDNDI